MNTFKTALFRALPRQQVRLYSSQPQRPKSATGEFYKAWTRPVAKTALLAVFTYQVIYWGWTKLEYDEIKETKEAEITRLEALVKHEQQKQQQQAKK
ncbi:hypothetical protein QBC38DRAFT_471220 [Podospora fimiseda]|uniref:Uncharacterized protein n=1 Tax=Podospora fimiseda TaxID=252190 RepID=A0AAN7BUU0_9PEZI|nr:hypothetical protein QBC38DRAFT_471220 [Podospora fimiseda]